MAVKVWKVIGGIMRLNEGENELSITLQLVPPPEAILLPTVKDKSAKPLADVKVTASGKTAYTDSSGKCRIEGLPVGDYPVTFEKSGYVTVTR